MRASRNPELKANIMKRYGRSGLRDAIIWALSYINSSQHLIDDNFDVEHLIEISDFFHEWGFLTSCASTSQNRKTFTLELQNISLIIHKDHNMFFATVFGRHNGDAIIYIGNPFDLLLQTEAKLKKYSTIIDAQKLGLI
jgi:hypothetical protein